VEDGAEQGTSHILHFSILPFFLEGAIRIESRQVSFACSLVTLYARRRETEKVGLLLRYNSSPRISVTTSRPPTNSPLMMS
jgi:hypothetical protein